MKRTILTYLILGLAISSNYCIKTSPSISDCSYFAAGAVAMSGVTFAYNHVFNNSPVSKAKTAAVIYGMLNGITVPTLIIPIILNDYAVRAIKNHASEDSPTEQVLNSRISEADMCWWTTFLGGIVFTSGVGLKYFWK